MIEFVEQNIIVIAMGGIVSAGGVGFRYLKCKVDEVQHIKDCVLAINADRLEHLCERAIESKVCSFNDRRKIKRLFVAYEGLGGNGYLKEMVGIVYNLPYELEEQ